MTWMLKFSRYTELTASTLGIILNFVLFYVIITLKSKMGNYNRILLQNCFMDICFAITTILAGVHVVNINNFCYIITGSWLSTALGFEYARYFFALFCACLILSIQALPIPFYVRYQLLCKGKVATVQQYIFMYTAAFAAGATTAGLLLWCYPPNFSFYVPFRAAVMTDFWLDEFPNGPIFFTRRTEEIQTLTLYGIGFVTSFVSYCFVLYFSIQMTKYLRNHVSTFAQTKIHNKQLHWTLIAQAIGPLIVGNCPVFMILVMAFCGIENNYISVGLSSMLGWVCVVNPLAALIIMSPYRNRIAEILKIQRPQNTVNLF